VTCNVVGNFGVVNVEDCIMVVDGKFCERYFLGLVIWTSEQIIWMLVLFMFRLLHWDQSNAVIVVYFLLDS
jgi:hypothetical protein